jgi:DNA replication protein DnaC
MAATVLARGNGTRQTSATRPARFDPECVGTAVGRMMTPLTGLSADEEARLDERYERYHAERRQREEEVERHRRKEALSAFLRARGRRYRDCTLDSYDATGDLQRELVKLLRTYSESITEKIDQGAGIVLFGPSGTGKDHLLVALAKVALEHGHTVRWTNGLDLFADLRDAMTDNVPEGDVIDRLTRSDVLVLSDPVPPVGALTVYQAATLLRAIDRRYSDLKPTWVSLNVKNGDEADERIGAAVVDRLRDGALCYFCDWPSWRRAAA